MRYYGRAHPQVLERAGNPTIQQPQKKGSGPGSMLLGRANLTLGEVQVSSARWQQCHWCLYKAG